MLPILPCEAAGETGSPILEKDMSTSSPSPSDSDPPSDISWTSELVREALLLSIFSGNAPVLVLSYNENKRWSVQRCTLIIAYCLLPEYSPDELTKTFSTHALGHHDSPQAFQAIEWWTCRT